MPAIGRSAIGLNPRVRAALITSIAGVLFAWLVLILMAFHQPKIYDERIFFLAAIAGIIYALIVRLIAAQAPRIEKWRAGAAGCGCVYAVAAFLFFSVIAGIAGGLTQTAFALYTPGSAAIACITIGGLGIFGGLQFARLRRAEEERRRGALERQQLELARDLQQRLLPPPKLETDRFRIVARNVPAAYVAGDFYDFVPIGNDRMLIVIADVAGKGVAAGLIVATVKAMIPLIASTAESPDEILRALNARIAPQLSKREFVAMALAIYDAASGAISIANAGIPDPLVVRANDVTPLIVEGPRYPVGVRSVIEYASITTTLNAGDRVLFFTDGIAEANVEDEPLGYRRLADIALRARGDIDTLFLAIEAMTTGTHDDDWTALTLERL